MTTVEQLGDILDIEVFSDIQDSYPKYLDEGGSGRVYSLSDSLVIKVPSAFVYSIVADLRSHPSPYYIENNLRRLIYEFEIQKRLHEEGFPVPKPEGVFNCSIPTACSGWLIPGMIMERLYGINGRYIQDDDKRIKNRYKAEIKKAKDLGFSTGDIGSHNCMYSEELDKLWLIDFGLWSKR